MFTMNSPLLWVVIHLFTINIFTFAVFGTDKLYALSNSWRVRERTLLILALLGGSLGALLGQHAFRHKIRKSGFSIILLFILIVQLGLVIYFGEKILLPLNSL